MKADIALLWENEALLHQQYDLIAGVDEAGRGPLAGPVVIAAVILKHGIHIDGLNDSKQVTADKREKLYAEIIHHSLAYSIVEIPHTRIDEINILQAVLEGMRKAVMKLSIVPQLVILDGNKSPKDMPCETRTIVSGDALYASIAAGSILAKVTRDRIMRQMHTLYPEYGFDRHKGYATLEHLKALNTYGACPIHRLSFAPVAQLNIDLN